MNDGGVNVGEAVMEMDGSHGRTEMHRRRLHCCGSGEGVKRRERKMQVLRCAKEVNLTRWRYPRKSSEMFVGCDARGVPEGGCLRQIERLTNHSDRTHS